MSIIASGAKAPRTPKAVTTVPVNNETASMTLEQLKAELAAARAENAKLKGAKSIGGVSFRVSTKGAVSVSGSGRFPVTPYKEQFERLLAAAEALTKFMAENVDSLSVKGE